MLPWESISISFHRLGLLIAATLFLFGIARRADGLIPPQNVLNFEVDPSLALQTLETTPTPSPTPEIVTEPAQIEAETPKPTQTPSETPKPRTGQINKPEIVVEKPETAVKGDCEAYRAIVAMYFPENAVDTAIRIMNAESGCNPEAVGDKHLKITPTTGMSCGLMQVRVLPGRPDCESLKNPETNLANAAKLFHGGGWSHWSVCKNGKVNCGIKQVRSQPDTKSQPASSSEKTPASQNPLRPSISPSPKPQPPKNPPDTLPPVNEKALVEESIEPVPPEPEA